MVPENRGFGLELMVPEDRRFSLEIGGGSRWVPSTIHLHHTQQKPSLFKLFKVVILVEGYSQMRMLIESL